jgi:hypothetical protein
MIRTLQRIPLMVLINLRTARSAILAAAVWSGTMIAAIARHREELRTRAAAFMCGGSAYSARRRARQQA